MLCWLHIPHCCKSHVTAKIVKVQIIGPDKQKKYWTKSDKRLCLVLNGDYDISQSYGEPYKIWNNFHFSTKYLLLVIRTGIHKMLACSEAV